MDGPWLVTVHDTLSNELGYLACDIDGVKRYGTKISEQFAFLRASILKHKKEWDKAPKLLERLSN